METDSSHNPPVLSLHHFLGGSRTFHHKQSYNWISMQQSNAGLDVPARRGTVVHHRRPKARSSPIKRPWRTRLVLSSNTWLCAVTQTKGKVAILVVIVVSRENLLPLRRCQMTRITPPPACLCVCVCGSSQTAPPPSCFLCYFFLLHQMLRTSFWGIKCSI